MFMENAYYKKSVWISYYGALKETFFFKAYIKNCLDGREMQRQRWNYLYHLLVHFPNVCTKSELGQAKARGQELHLGLWHGWQGPKNPNLYLPLPRCE